MNDKVLMTSEERLYAASNSILSDHHNEITYWPEDFETKNGRPMTLNEAKELIVGLASNSGAELSDEAVEEWCYETAEDNPDLIQC